MFGAHCDDETIGLGGTIYKHTQRGDEVKVVIMTRGTAGGLGVDPEELARVREAEARRACSILGVKDVEFLGFKDEYLFIEEEPLKAVGRIIRGYKPHRIYTHHADGTPAEDNLDHINTFHLVVRAAFTVKWPQAEELGSEPWNTPEIYTYEVLTPLHHPTTYVDITDVVEVKIRALKEYRSQMMWGRWDEAILGLNRFRGIISRTGEYAEAFTAVKTRPFYEGRLGIK